MSTTDSDSAIGRESQNGTSTLSAREFLKEGNPLTWLQRGVWAVSDQGLFAGGNFVLNILLARWLLPEEFGAYATALTAYTFVVVVHQALLSDPMLVFGPGRFESRFEEYFGTLLYGHFGVCLFVGVLLVLTSFVLPPLVGRGVVAPWLSFALVSPFILLSYFARKACYAVHKPSWAAQASGLYLVVLLALLFIVHHLCDALTAASAFGIMGVAGLFSGFALVYRLRPEYPRLRRANTFVKSIARAHWVYGRWTTATGLMGWTPGWIWYLVLPAWVGLEAGATLRALTNFAMPMGHVLGALGTVLVPTFVASRRHSARRFALLFWCCLLLLGGAALVYWAGISYYGTTLVHWVYDGKYASETYLLIILCFVPVVRAVGIVADSSLHSSERPDLVFFGSLAAFVLTVTLGLLLTYWHGLQGAAWGNLVAMVAMALVSILFAIRNIGWVYAQEGAAPSGLLPGDVTPS